MSIGIVFLKKLKLCNSPEDMTQIYALRSSNPPFFPQAQHLARPHTAKLLDILDSI